MSPNTIPLTDLRLPDYPNTPLTLNGQPLSIYEENSCTTPQESTSTAAPVISTSNLLSIPTGLATLLYSWHPTTLLAFLDLDAWFSLTWSVTLPSTKKLEIGRVGSQITFGTLDSGGENWDIMLTYNMAMSSDTKFKRGQWVPNVKESMLGEADVTSGEEIERLGRDWVGSALEGKVWKAGKGVKHTFHVEYAPMDIFGDGIPVNPHWLYASLDLSKCTTCDAQGSPAKSLNRCGRCGTAAYCSGECQKRDWDVHKWICTMTMEDRGQAIKISEKGGLYKWDTERTMAAQGEELESENPNFQGVVLRRMRV